MNTLKNRWFLLSRKPLLTHNGNPLGNPIGLRDSVLNASTILPFNWFKWTQASHNESMLCNPKPASLLGLAQAILIPPLLDTCVCLKLSSRSFTTFFGKLKSTIKWKAHGLFVPTKPLIDSLSWAQLFTRKAGYVFSLTQVRC